MGWFGFRMSFWYECKEKEPLVPPGRPKYLDYIGHYRPTTSTDKRHKNLLIRKRRDKKKRNKRRHRK